MRQPIDIGQRQRNGRNAPAELRQRRMNRAINGLGFTGVRQLNLGVVFRNRLRFRVIAGRRHREHLQQYGIPWHMLISSTDGF